MGGGHRETGTTKNLTRDQECRKKPSGLNIEGRNPDTRRNTELKKHIRQATPVDASKKSRTIAGGAVSYAPQPTPDPSTTSRTGWEQTYIRGNGIQERALVNSLTEDSAGGVLRMDDGSPDAAGGDSRLTDTDREEAKGKIKRERKRANCSGKGTRVNPGGGDKGRGGGRTIIGRELIAN